jgi:hypothetical protein
VEQMGARKQHRFFVSQFVVANRTISVISR